MGIGIGFAPDFLNTLSHAQNISDGLFPHQDHQMNFHLEIYPEPTPGVDEISLTINGNVYRYRNEPQQWQQLNWNINHNNNSTILKVITAKQKNPLTIEINSTWGLYQLLRRADITQEQNSIYRATWKFTDAQGNNYKICLLFKLFNQTELFHDILGGTLQFTNQTFVSK